MNKAPTRDRSFPLHEDREFLSESEWVIFKLLCRPVDSFAHADAHELSEATGGQVSVSRCDQLIRTVRIRQLPGLGSWIARLLAEAGFDRDDLCRLPAKVVAARLNEHLGYPICNQATIQRLDELRMQWEEIPEAEGTNA